jgi:photosynthetic reaction center cytochrome c subunit
VTRLVRALRVKTAGVLGALLVCLSSLSLAAGQAGPSAKPLMAEEVFKNVQVLKGVPADEFMGAMGFFSNALSADCSHCHIGAGGGGWAKYAEDNGPKETARRMVVMMNAINRTYFAGRRVVTCVSCHNGVNRPKTSMSMATVYGTAPTDEPDEILKQAPGSPSAAQVLDKYLQALGGTERLAKLTSFVAKGTYIGYGDAEKRPVEIFAKAPGQRTTIIHTLSGDVTMVYDGRLGWAAAPETDSPIPVRVLTGGELEGARLDADLSFPARVAQTLSDWRGAIPATLEDRDVLVIQGTSALRFPVKLYFDADSGLLARLVRYADTPVGRNATQIDYSDYREVAGVKMPFRWVVAWQSGHATFELSDVQPNASIEENAFARPIAPVAPTR